MLLMDCHELRDAKRYMYCILNICQAYEMFFSLYFRSRLYHGFANEISSRPLDRLNALVAELHTRLSGFTFGNLRANFVRVAIDNPHIGSLEDAQAILQQIDRSGRGSTKSDITACKDAKLREKLSVVQATKIHHLRNQVVHKSGYRPTRGEVDAALKEASDVLFTLSAMLGVWDDEINIYVSKLA